MGLAQSGIVISEGHNIAVAGVRPMGIAVQGNVIWRGQEEPVVEPWLLLAARAASGTTLPMDTTGATLLVVAVAYTGAAQSVTDNQGNSFTSGVSINAGSPGLSEIFYCPNPTTSINHTFTFTGSYNAIVAMAFSGPSDIAVDKSSTTIAGQAQSFQVNPITPTQANTLIVASYTNGVNGITPATIDSGFTIAGSLQVSGGNYGTGAAYFADPAMEPIAPTWTFATSVSYGLGATMLSFGIPVMSPPIQPPQQSKGE
jgi:hypothetical protein